MLRLTTTGVNLRGNILAETRRKVRPLLVSLMIKNVVPRYMKELDPGRSLKT